jgi:hypothetical protein
MKLKLRIAICIVFLALLLIKCQNQQKTTLEISNNLDCLYKDNSSKIKDTFPFSEADKIEVISFSNGEGAVLEIENDAFKLKDAKVRKRSIKEQVVLKKQEIKNLFSILYNYNTKDSSSIATDCYDPHHAILFYKSDKAIDFLEVCFHCKNIRNSEKESFDGFCAKKYDKLGHFIKQLGFTMNFGI